MPSPNPAAFAFLAQRRSIPAKTLQPPVPGRAELRIILAAATRVPDHGKLQPWRLVVIEPPAMARLADLAEARARALDGDGDGVAEKIAKGRGQFDLGLLAVAVIAAPKPSEKIPPVEQLLSAGAVCLGILNAAEALGYGANWLTGWPSHDRDFIARAFDCTETETVVGIVHIASAAPAMPDSPRPDSPRPDRPRPNLDALITWAAP